MAVNLFGRDIELTTSHQLAPVIVPWVFIALATAAVTLRFAARRMRKVSIGPDDWLCLLALVITFPYQASNTYAVTRGVGTPFPIVGMMDPTYIPSLIKAIFSSNILWAFTVSVLQISVLLLYIRIFGVSRWLRWSSWVLIGLISAFWLSTLIAQALTCQPLDKFFNPRIPGKCFNQYRFCASAGLIHVVLDLAVIFLPIPLIWNLKTSRSNKVVLSAVLGIGLFASITSLLKLTCLIHYHFLNGADPSGSLWFSVLFQAIEIPLGVICACVPTLAPVWMAVKQSTFGSSARRFLSGIRSPRRSNIDSSASNSSSEKVSLQKTKAGSSVVISGPGRNGRGHRDDFSGTGYSYSSNTHVVGGRANHSFSDSMDERTLNNTSQDLQHEQQPDIPGEGGIQVSKTWYVHH